MKFWKWDLSNLCIYIYICCCCCCCFTYTNSVSTLYPWLQYNFQCVVYCHSGCIGINMNIVIPLLLFGFPRQFSFSKRAFCALLVLKQYASSKIPSCWEMKLNIVLPGFNYHILNYPFGKKFLICQGSNTRIRMFQNVTGGFYLCY